MFKDKQLHSALATLINKFADYLQAFQAKEDSDLRNFTELSNSAATTLEKLEKIHRTIYDSCDRSMSHSKQLAEVYTLVKGLNLAQRQVEWYEDNTKKLEAERDLLQADNAKLQHRIKELEDYAAQCDVVIHNQSLELVQLRDSLKDANEQAIKAAFTPPAQPVQQQPIVVNNQFNMQELASELSKYLNPNPVDNSRLQPPTPNQFEPFADPAPLPDNADSVKAYLRRTAAGTESNSSSVSSASEALANLVVPDNSLNTPSSYIPSPAQEEPDEIVVEQLVFTDPAVAHRIQSVPSGPVLLPSERQRAFQLAELGAVGVLQQNQNG